MKFASSGSKLIPQRCTILSLLAAAGCALAAPVHAGIVTSAADDGTPGTLRSVMAAAAPGDSITFDPSLTGQTITLTGGQLLIDKNLSITGPGAAQLTISGNHTTRAFQVSPGVSAMIEGLTIRDGYAFGGGGGIFNQGTLTVSQSTLSGNSAVYSGGGIVNQGTLTLSHSTLSGNSARDGGGFYNGAHGRMTVSDSTLSGNSAVNGGGYLNDTYATLTVSDSTLSGNSASNFGGCIFNTDNGTVNLKNSIVANSPSGGDCYNYNRATLNVAGVNFDTDGTCPGFTHVTSADLNLGPLADNGGPTMTHALLPGSVAIDAATDFTDFDGHSVITDQRGAARWQGAASDVGAYEESPDSGLPVASNDSYTVLENETQLVPAPGVLANDSDPHGAPVSLLAATRPAHGTLALYTDGAFRYTPDQYFYGSDSFTYLITDGLYGAAVGTVNLNVTHANQSPTANAQTVTAFNKFPLNITLTGSDIDGDPFSFAVLTAPLHGTLSGTPPTLTYSPAPDYVGTDSFTFKANDGVLDSAPATVTIQVKEVTIWGGPKTAFTKPDFTDGRNPIYQDPLTPEVRLAVDEYGNLYNAVTELYSDVQLSPADTEWAFGTTADPLNLSYQPFLWWSNFDPGYFVGRDAVLHLISENIYLDIKFTYWSWDGGFTYERATPFVTVTLNGSQQSSTLCGGTFIDPGATAADLNGNPLEVTVTGTVDTTTPGTYLLTYSATDADGHVGRALRIVHVGSIIVDVYSGFNPAGGGAPYSGLVGSFLATNLNFGTDTVYDWHPFGLGVFGADIRGALNVESAGTYPFTLISDDGSLLYIDGNLIVDNSGIHGAAAVAGSVDLTAGRHCFEVQFYNAGGAGGVDLQLPNGVSYACPILNCPSGVVVNTAAGACGATVTFAQPAADLCFGLTVSCSAASGSFFPVGSTPVICQATDAAGHVLVQCSFNVTVIDNKPPVPDAASLPDVIAQCSATRPAAPTATDACDGRITATTTAPATFGPGDFTIVWTFTDSHGNSTQQNQQVHVHDTIAPTISCPADMTIITTSASGMTANYPAATANDNCSTPTLTYSKASGSSFGLGTTNVSVTATDASGKSAQCSFKVNVVYSWSGVLQPINADGSSVFKLGTTVQVKFQLTGASAGITNAVAKLRYTKLSSTPPGPVNEATSTGSATSGNLFRYDSKTQQYVFNWGTKGLTTGIYQLNLDLGDGVARAVKMALK